MRIGETQLTVKGIIREEDAASGAWVEFTHIRRGDRRILQSLVVQLSRWKKGEIKNRPVEELCGPDHLCLFYSSREEQLAAVIPFLRAGLRRSERCVCIVDEDPAALIDACRDAGILVDDVIAAGALLVLTKWDTYLKRGDFDPEWMLQFLQDQVAAAKAAGFAALRVTGEMAWIDTKLDAARFLEYETRLNEVIPRIGLLGLCQYHRNRVGPEMIAGIFATHPRIVESDGIHLNSTYRAV
ncbi:MAG: MEDS domain-containing protein [Candidatus Sulfotelmatobacter sp.]